MIRFSRWASAVCWSMAVFTTAHAQTEIQWWHSMGGALGEWVNDLAQDFNKSQNQYKVVPVFKGSYDESMTAAIAAFRAEIDDPVGSLDYVEIVFNHHHGVTVIA